MVTQTEAQLEESLLDRLVKLGWDRITIQNDAELIANLKIQLEAHNRVVLTDAEFERVLNHLDRGNVFERAKTLRDRYELAREDGSRLYIEFLNTHEWCQNRYQVTHQITQEGSYRNRYDVTLLVNGLPLIQIELKRRGLEIKEAFNQVNRYHRHSFTAGRGLFQYIQLFVISNGVNTRYYANNRKQSFKQTFTWSREDNKPLNQLSDFAETFLDKCHVSKMIAKYTVLHEGDRQLMVLRPYQFYAVEAIIDRVKNSIKGGYIWHTTGSGKTLTSFKASQILTEMPEVDKVVFVVDRADLDYQTTREFNAYSDGSVDGTNNTHKLVRQFTDSTRLIVTTIQKLNAAISRSHFLEQMAPLANRRIVFIFDECHRSQFGETHKRITSFFTNYQMFGFTGTPIFELNANKSEAIARTTRDLFGDCLHRYVITDAIRDENVLRFSIEYWGKLRRRDGSLIDEKVAGIDTREFFESPDRIEGVVDWIISNHARKTHNRDFTAILAVGSVDALIQYYEFFRAKKALGVHDLRVATIFTYGTNEDDKDANGLISEPDFEIAADTPANRHSREKLDSFILDYNTMYGTAFTTKDSLSFYNYYKDIAKRIKERERENASEKDRVDILLVVAMFLTGFDAKKVNTLYLDKNLKYHGLIQAYSRTNRILNEVKSQGNIVSFRNLKSATDEALALFADKAANETVLIDPYDSYVERFNACAAVLMALTPTVDSVDALEDENQRLAFVRAFRELARIRNVLGVFAEFDWADLAMDSQMFDDFKSKYLDIHDLTRKATEEGTVSIINDVDFELELIRHDKVNVAYILQLLRNLTDEELTENPDAVAKQKRVADILDIVTSEPQLRSKRELIEKFIQQNMPQIGAGEDIETSFRAYWEQERDAAIANLCVQERLDRERFDRLIDHFNFTGHTPLRDDVVNALVERPKILERRKIVDRIIERMTSLIHTFEDNLGEV
ncbi:type I restriction endonuclease subunit R [Microvirga sp. HBU67558]|uniref:type I restriction endonuclease subunit R n=1 Tax=Microvirga TaxID=186650 RepID=UPI001B3785B7|nr:MULTISPECIES: type I restriction endonuclease subunit R [unclassified Microvirga]MBQ0820619.1 type I restriction endonuclease subunit R [Microvirga sp. HBU67558]